MSYDNDSMTGEVLALPTGRTSEAVYSNFDHKLHGDVVQQLAGAPGELHAQHAAWNFCGFVWQRPDGRWVDQVWRYGVPVEDIVDDSPEAVVARANETYGLD